MSSLKVDLEIIVASSDPSPFHIKYFKRYGVKWFKQPGGPARKRNVAMRMASHDIVAFFDDDVEVEPEAVFEMAQVLAQEKDCGMVYGKTLNYEDPTILDGAGSYLTPTGFLWAREEGGLPDKEMKTDYVLAGKSAACMVKKKAMGLAGMFDEDYEILGEETDLSWRIWLVGFKVIFCPNSRTLHKFNTKFKPKDFYIPRRVYFNGPRNYLFMLITNLENLNFVIPVLIHAIVWSLSAVGFLLTGKTEAGINIFKGLGFVISHLDLVHRKRLRVQKMRVIRDKDLFKYILRTPPISYYTNRLKQYVKEGRHG